MKKSSVQLADEIEFILHTYGNMLFRLCFITLGNAADADEGAGPRRRRECRRRGIHF